ncbi:extracellular solute-binding protein [Roseibium sp. M-1]
MTRVIGAAPKAVRNPSRRNFLQGTAAAAAAGLMASPLIVTPGRAQASAVLRVADDGGQTHEGRKQFYLEPYMQETGVEVQNYLGARGLARMKAMVDTENLEFDVTNDTATNSLSAAREGLLETIDYTRLHPDRFVTKDWMWDHTVAFQSVTGGLGYNSENVPADKVPQTWADFFNTEAFPGRRGLLTRPSETLEIALVADGVSPDDLYPLDLDRAFAFLDKVKDRVDIWVPETPKTIEHLMTGELDYCYTFSGRVAIAQGQNFPVGFASHLSVLQPQNFSILKGVKNYDLCIEFIDWWLTNEEANVAYYSKFLGNGPIDKPSYEALPNEAKANLPDWSNPNNIRINPAYWGENLEEVSGRFQLWQLN